MASLSHNDNGRDGRGDNLQRGDLAERWRGIERTATVDCTGHLEDQRLAALGNACEFFRGLGQARALETALPSQVRRGQIERRPALPNGGESPGVVVRQAPCLQLRQLAGEALGKARHWVGRGTTLEVLAQQRG